MRVIHITFFFLLFLTILQVSKAVDVDTRIGHSDEKQSFVYDSQQTFTHFARMIGDVEFRKGLIAAGDSVRGLLGVTPPLAGTIELASGGAFLIFHVINDLTLGKVKFAGQNTDTINNGIRTFDFNVTGSHTIFMTKDIQLENLARFEIISSSGAVLDGMGNKFILDSNVTGTFTPNLFQIVSSGFPGAVKLKNLIVEGVAATPLLQSNFHFTSSSADVHCENVGFIAHAGDTAFIGALNGVLNFLGPNNFAGFGGTVRFENSTSTASGAVLFKIASKSRLSVFPNTTMQLSCGNINSITVQFTDSTSELFLDNCTLRIGNTFPVGGTIRFLKGTIYVNGNVTLTTAFGEKLQLGDGISQANNCNLIILPGSKLIVGDGAQLVNMNV